ncbi:tetratricopeptide repeat protein [Lusitaniella coriacea LEGE 07157]|uniref:Tetratricopeptide repeat protein n=1 Tax=Lusitaniella coriacea LEGE 07157 TaxID=945747 RepID=A0A8J7DZG8_9CYAN|nr:tetratricopeptide repeat protein [Lusitaniella coriacea]MBE9117333.1 tetratricopeptide repeat protein [Lusitaniella coriacea LEGE 07157]
MEWIEFLDSVAIKHKLTPEQRETLKVRLDKRNDDKSNIQISNDLHISEALLKKRLSELYKIFESGCPDLARSKSRGKLEALRACLWKKYERQQSQPPQPETIGIPNNLPLSGVVKFVGQEKALETVHEKLQEAATVAITSVSGMGGVGKTELALQYAYQKLKEEAYPGGICWVNVRAKDAGIAIVEFARIQLGLPEPPDTLENVPQQVEWVCRRWKREPVLLVLDDVVDYGQVKSYLDKLDSRFRVLMTTRLQLGTAAKRLELPVLKRAAAFRLLRVLVADDKRMAADVRAAKALCEWVGYLPLGLELVGRYLEKKQDLSLAGMVGRLEDKRLAAQALIKTKEKQKKYQQDMTAQLGVAAAFELSWVELPEEARVLCGLLSIFALAPIPWQLVEQCLPEWDEEELEDCRDEELLGRNLLSRVERGNYQLHQLIREFFGVKLAEELGKGAEALRQRFAVVLTEVAKTIPQTTTLTDIARVEEALPHLAVVAEGLTYLLEGEDAINPFVRLAWVAQTQSRWPEAEHWHTACLEMTETRFGSNHSSTAISLNNLAELYRAMGRYSKAETLYKRSLHICEIQFGDHPLTATSLNNLGLLYKFMGRYSEAEPLYKRSLQIREALLNNQHPHIAQSLNNLAELYRIMGDYSAAESLFVRALKIDEKSYNKEHPEIATDFNNLAGLYHLIGRDTKAEILYQEALRIRKMKLGSEHPLTIQSLNNLAALYYVVGRYGEAEPLYLRTLEILTQGLPKNHPHIQTAWGNFYYLIQQALQNRKAGELSAHPLTQGILQEIQGTSNG